MPKIPDLIGKISLEDFDAFGELIPGYKGFFARRFPESYDEFVSLLHEDIGDSIKLLEENPELHHELSEDQLTIQIVNNLRTLDYNANHERKFGGHTDISVQNNANKWLWIGEAKKHSSYPWLLKGFQQLLTRYTNGRNGDKGGLIIYITNVDALSVIDSWKVYLSENAQCGNIMCDTGDPLIFTSEHQHPVSGGQFSVRHMPVLLHFNPQDA